MNGYMIVFNGDTICEYTIYLSENEAEKVRKEQYSNYNAYVLTIPMVLSKV